MNTDGSPSIDPDDISWIDKLQKLFTKSPKTREDINEILEQAKEDQLLDGDELELIEGAMEVGDMQVREVMIPRSNMITVSVDEKPEQFLPTVIKSGHSRFPIIGETNDDILGILHAKDLLPLILEDNEEFDISKYIREVHQVPESKRLSKLLNDFRTTRSHMALVIDEYGGISGLITIEDVLEEIVGEIEDEFDTEEDAPIKKLGENDYIINALIPIEDFNTEFDCKLDDRDFDTIAGLVTHQLGHVPQRNEQVEIDKFTFRVVHSDKRRIHLLRLFVTE